MAEIKTAWLAYFDGDENVVVVECPEAKVTAKQVKVKVTVPDYTGRPAVRTYDIEKVRFSRDEALAKLRREVMADLAFLQEKRMTANKQLHALNKFEGIK